MTPLFTFFYINAYLADIFSKYMKGAFHFKENKVFVANDKIQVFNQKNRTLENFDLAAVSLMASHDLNFSHKIGDVLTSVIF